MKIPESFITAIKKQFYDKEILFYEIEEVADENGYVKKALVGNGDSVLGNVRFGNLEEVKQDYGIMEDIELVITTDVSVSGRVAKYRDRYYEVVKNIPFDSHNLIVCKKWLLKQKALKSA